MRAQWITLATACWSLAAFAPTLAAPLAPDFTYQGRLMQGGTALTGTADFQFKLFDQDAGGSQIGATWSVNNLFVSDGFFATLLNFGATGFNGDARWLEIAVRSPAGGGSFTTLGPRQPLTATPYALQTRGLYVDPTNRVGIGTLAPSSMLSFGNSIANSKLLLWDNGPGTGLGFGIGPAQLRMHLNVATDRFAFLNAPAGSEVFTVRGTGNVTMDGNPEIGTHHGDYQQLRIGGGNSSGYLYGSFPHFGDGIHLGYNYYANAAGANQIVQPGGATSRVSMGYGHVALATGDIGAEPTNHLWVSQGGNVGIGTDLPGTKLDVNGTTRTKVLEISGADLAEKFPTSERVKPGMVVAIDANDAGKLCLASGAYNRAVAGVVSGANDFPAGAILGNDPRRDDDPAVALSGRVYVWCDASREAIRPGDLLTTSDVPGHAMKAADPARAPGAILGKAMSRLDSGRGLVLVLVSLQ